MAVAGDGDRLWSGRSSGLGPAAGGGLIDGGVMCRDGRPRAASHRMNICLAGSLSPPEAPGSGLDGAWLPMAVRTLRYNAEIEVEGYA